MELRVSLHYEDDGTLWAEVQDLPGLFASGDTLPELIEAVEEAVALYLAEPAAPVRKVKITSFGVAVPDSAEDPELQPA